MRYNVCVATKSTKNPAQAASSQVIINIDRTPILYTDNIMVTTNDEGVVVDFCQRIGSTSQVRVVARIGMSRDHAKKFLMVLASQVEQPAGSAKTSTRIIN